MRFLLIDFEFSGVTGGPMDIHDYIFASKIPFGAAYTDKHDLFFVGELVRGWALVNDAVLDASAAAFLAALEDPNTTAAAALGHAWLQNPHEV